MMDRRALFALMVLALPGTAGAQPSRAAPAPPIALPAGMSPLPKGAYRVIFRGAETSLPAGAAEVLAEIGRRLAAAPAGSGRIIVEGQASGPRNDASTARRVSLERAIVVRRALAAGGLDETRVDVRALGRVSAGLDAADVLPPGAAPPSGQRG
jgi:outer membrane protein OmpA-like peptidoglycan-associated protein